MDYVTRQFVNLTKKFRKELRKLAELLHSDLKEHTEAVHAAKKSSEDQRNIQPIWLEPILAKYQEPTGNQKASDERHYRVQNSIRWATWCAFIAASVYGAIAAVQLQQMKMATSATKKAACVADQTLKRRPYEFRIEQRPYAVLGEFKFITAPAPPTQANPNGESMLELWFVNSGKTPAIDFFLDPTTLDFRIGSAIMKLKVESVSRAVIPSERGFTYNLPFALNEPFKTQYENNKLVVMVRGVATYSDVFNIQHRTIFCGQNRKVGGDGICGEPGSNSIDHEDPSTYASQDSCEQD
jgi:hypothetical protein